MKNKQILKRWLSLYGDSGDEACEHGCHCKECESCIEYNKLVKDTEEVVND